MKTKRTACFAYVGCRTTKERNARGRGLSVYALAPERVEWDLVQLVESLENPSFLAFDRPGRTLYPVHGDRSEISAFSIDPHSGQLGFINQASTGGKNPVHLCVSPDNRFIVVANHITSSLALLPILAEGAVGELVDLVTLTGKTGPHRIEQPFPKPHQTLFDAGNQFIAVPDKGLDKTFVFRIDTTRGKLLDVGGATANALEGAGPRHIVFHPSNRFAYIINELNSTVSACHFDAATGKLSPFQNLPSLPDVCVVNSRASEIAITGDGRFLYASNRGYDSVAVYAVDAASGRLSFIDCTQAQGKTPRFISIGPNEDTLFIANEDSDEILDFAIDARSGCLKLRGTAARTGSPVCILFRPAD